jgi:hypothetical protein
VVEFIKIPVGGVAVKNVKKIIALYFLASLLLIAAACVPADALEGFRGERWGQSLASMGSMKFVDELDGLRYYIKMNDRMSMGDAAIHEIHYAFESGRLVGVILSSKGQKNARLILKTLETAYGTPSKRDGNKFYWSFGGATLFYSYNPYSGRLYVASLSRPAIGHVPLAEYW